MNIEESIPSEWSKKAQSNFNRCRKKLDSQKMTWVGSPDPGTKWIPVSGGNPSDKVVVDEKNYDYINQWNWSLNNYGYAVRKIKGVAISMHRAIIKTPKGFDTDHINHDKLDNRESNLRICTIQQNQFNRLKTNGPTSKYKGVSLCKRSGLFLAFIKINKKSKNLGRFQTEEMIKIQ